MSVSLRVDGRFDKEFLADIVTLSVLILTALVAVWQAEWLWVLGCAIGSLVFLVPIALHRYRNDILPWPIDVLVAAICLLNMGGVLLNAYYVIPFYNEATQLLVSVLVAFMAFAIVYMLDRYWDGLKMNIYAMVYVVAVTTMAAMVVFEAIKYIGFFGARSTSVEGMLTSMIVGSIGGILMGLACLWLVNKGRFDPLFDNLGSELNEKLIREDGVVRKKMSRKHEDKK